MVGILISTIPSMYLFIFTGFWHPAGKNPVPKAGELSETIGTSEKNTDRERMIILTIFFFLCGFCWHLAGTDAHIDDTHTHQVIQGKKKQGKRKRE